MNKKIIGIIACIMSLGSLVGCNNAADATVNHVTAESLHGHVTGLKTKGLKAGDKITFTVAPDEDFKIDKVTLKGQKLEAVKRGSEEGSWVYSGKVSGGENKLVVTYKIKPSVDVVDKFKLNCSDDVFEYVTSKVESDKDHPADKTALDFRAHGIEQCRAPVGFDENNQRYSKAKGNDDFFLNCVDGDTTHVETFNLKYTVKIRYLMIDTPESTSSLEKWGLSASYYSKYIYWGEFGEEEGRDAHYPDKVRSAMDTQEEFDAIKAGASHIILMSESLGYALSTDPDSVTVDSIMSGEYKSITDGNKRDLCYVWYSTVQNPTKDDYRCLNLEMVYQGYSSAVGSDEERGEYFFKYFDEAQLSATANDRHAASENENKTDVFFDNYKQEGYQVQNLTLEQLYASAPRTGDIASSVGYDTYSPYADKKTLVAIEGYVTRKVGQAFYIQNKPSYDRDKVWADRNKPLTDPDAEKPLGLYVFTYSETPVEPGHHVRVIGVLSTYGGTFQMQGISYRRNNPNPNRDLSILDGKQFHTIVPLPLTVAEFHELKLPQVLIQLKEDVHFYNFVSDYTPKGGETETSPINDGGAREVNTFSVDAYPYYNTSNALTLYGAYGTNPDCAAINEAHRAKDIRTTLDIIRIDVDEEVLIDNNAVSYKFFVGGSLMFNKNGVEYANHDEDNPYKDDTIDMNFPNRKKAVCNDQGLGVIGISHAYVSTTRKTCRMSLSITKRSDLRNYLQDVIESVEP